MTKHFFKKNFFILFLLIFIVLIFCTRKLLIRSIYQSNKNNTNATDIKSQLPWGINQLEAMILSDFNYKSISKSCLLAKGDYEVKLFFGKNNKLYKIEYFREKDCEISPNDRLNFSVDKVYKTSFYDTPIEHYVRLTWKDGNNVITEKGDIGELEEKWYQYRHLDFYEYKDNFFSKNSWIFEGTEKEKFIDKGLIYEEYWVFKELKVELCYKLVDGHVKEIASYTNLGLGNKD